MPRGRQTPELDNPSQPTTAPTAVPLLKKGDQADPAAARSPEALVTQNRRTAPQADVTRTAAKIRVGYYQHPDRLARARSAFHWSRLEEGHRSLSDFIDHAIMREVERVEGLYNDGQSWPPLDAGELPTGRPIGS